MSNFSTFFPQASGGTDWVATIQTSNFTAEAGKGYFVNTTSAKITITLPAGVVGKEIIIQDYAGTFATNEVILSSNGSEAIQGSTSINGQITIINATATLVYQDATRGWTSQDVALVPQGFSLSYLIVAGGGGGGGGTGGTGGAGGGAGGYRTNYPATLDLIQARDYVVTVGEGGAGGPGSNPSGYGVSGTDSSISGTGITTITSTGGGKGSAYASGAAGSGGSGGGGSYNSSGTPVSERGLGNTPATTPDQGNDGGVGSNNSPYGGGGGGGATTDGANASTVGGGGGNGGTGANNSITNTPLAYAGGGGGGTASGTGGAGGNGGGGTGGTGTNNGDNASPANRGSGGGGGGGGGATPTGGDGSDGVVIVRYPSSVLLSNAAGGLTFTTDSSVSGIRITTITAGTGNIQFN